MAMRPFRFALIPRRQRQGLYRGNKKAVEHYLQVSLREAGARIQRMEGNGDHVYVRLLLPEGANVQEVITRAKCESSAALLTRLKKAGLIYVDKLDFWAERHYMDVGADESNRRAMIDFVIDELLSKQQREQIAEYAMRKGATA